jgi:hypothetical protein
MTIPEHWDDRTPEQQQAIEARTGWLWDYYSGKNAGGGYGKRPAIFPDMRAVDMFPGWRNSVVRVETNGLCVIYCGASEHWTTQVNVLTGLEGRNIGSRGAEHDLLPGTSRR